MVALIVFGLTCASCCARTDAPLPKTHLGYMLPPPTAGPSQGDSGVYWLPQFFDMGERNNPQTRVAGEKAKQAAEGVGIALVFDALALKSNLRFGLPPNISSVGVIMADSEVVQPPISLAWPAFDFGGESLDL